MKQRDGALRHTDMAYVPRSYPRFDATWFLLCGIVAVIIAFFNLFVSIIFLLICAPFLIYRLLAFVIDLAGAWADRKWGYKLWIEDAMETPCQIHTYSTEDPACPYLHADQSGNTV